MSFLSLMFLKFCQNIEIVRMTHLLHYNTLCNNVWHMCNKWIKHISYKNAHKIHVVLSLSPHCYLILCRTHSLHLALPNRYILYTIAEYKYIHSFPFEKPPFRTHSQGIHYNTPLIYMVPIVCKQ